MHFAHIFFSRESIFQYRNYLPKIHYEQNHNSGNILTIHISKDKMLLQYIDKNQNTLIFFLDFVHKNHNKKLYNPQPGIKLATFGTYFVHCVNVGTSHYHHQRLGICRIIEDPCNCR